MGKGLESVYFINKPITILKIENISKDINKDLNINYKPSKKDRPKRILNSYKKFSFIKNYL